MQYLNKTKPVAWLLENAMLRGEKLQQHCIVFKMSANMDLNLWYHCLVSAMFFHLESVATNMTSPAIHDNSIPVK